MKCGRITKGLAGVLVFFLLSACSITGTQTTIEMDLTPPPGSTGPVVQEMTIYVSGKVLRLDVSWQMEGDSAVLEIVDPGTNEVQWSEAWDNGVYQTAFAVELDTLDPDKDYVIRFTGTGMKQGKITIRSAASLIRDPEQPQKPDKAAPSV